MQSGPANLPSASRSQYSLSRKSPLDCVHCYAAPYAESSYACLRALYLRFSCRGCAVDCLMRFYFPLGFQIQIPAVCVRVRACACLRCHASIRLRAWLSMEIFAHAFLRDKMRMGVRMDGVFFFFSSFFQKLHAASYRFGKFVEKRAAGGLLRKISRILLLRTTTIEAV